VYRSKQQLRSYQAACGCRLSISCHLAGLGSGSAMKVCLIAIFVISMSFLSVAHASDVKLKRLDEMLAEEASLAIAQTVLIRCFALHNIMENWLKRQKGKYSKNANAYGKSSFKIYEMWMMLNSITNKGSEEDRHNVFKGHVSVVKNVYAEKMLKSKMLSGNAFDDEIIHLDMTVCKDYQNVVSVIVDDINKKLKRK
jgi:hypothetical protein